MCFFVCLFLVAEVESEQEEDKSGDFNHPRDSGCFESSENLEGGREEGNKEQLEEQKKEERAEEGHQREEEQSQQLDAGRQQLEELTLDEGS